jgi:hypothetical protein
MMKSLLSTASIALFGLACEPTCEQTCQDLLACDELETDRMALDDCTAACVVQQNLYDDWEDAELQEGFADYKRCVSETTCDGIASGECYDEELYAW